MADFEKQSYESSYRSPEDNAIQDFVKFVDDRENLLKDFDPSKSIFSESHEAELEKHAKNRHAELHGPSDADRAITQLKEFQKTASEADAAKLMTMLQTLAFSINAIENSIYQSDVDDKDNKPGIKKRLEELQQQLLQASTDPGQLDAYRLKVRDLSAEVNRIYHKAKTEGVVIDFQDVPDINQQKIDGFQEELKHADAKTITSVATHIMTLADLARSQLPKEFEEKKLDEKMTAIVQKLNNLDTAGQVTPENINAVRQELHELANEIKIKPGTPENIYKFCDIIIDSEGEGSKYDRGREYQLIDEKGKFQPHNFMMWIRAKMDEARQNDPDSVISLYTGVTLVRDVQGGVRTIKLVDIFLEHTLMMEPVEKKVEEIDKNGQKTIKTEIVNEMTKEMQALQDYIGTELFCLHTSHNADAKYRAVMADGKEVVKVMNEMYHWNVFTNKNRLVTLWHAPSGTKEEFERMMKGEKFEGSFGRELQRFMRAYFYTSQVGAMTEVEAEKIIAGKRKELEKKNAEKKAKGEKTWTAKEMDAIAYGVVPYLIKDERVEEEVMVNGKKKKRTMRKVGSAVNKFEESLGEKGTKAFFETVCWHVIKDKLGEDVAWSKLVKEETDKKSPNPENAALHRLLADPQEFLKKIEKKNKENKEPITAEEIAVFQTNPKKFTETLLVKVMKAPKPHERRGGLAMLNIYGTPKVNWTIQQAFRKGLEAAAAAEDKDLIDSGRLHKQDLYYAETFANSMNYWLTTAGYQDTEGTGWDYAARWSRAFDYRIKGRSGVGELDTIPGFKMCVPPMLMTMNIRDKNQNRLSMINAMDKAWDKDPKKRESLIDHTFDLNTQRQTIPDAVIVGSSLYEYLTTRDGMQLDKMLTIDQYTGRVLYQQSALTNAIRKGPEKWCRYLYDTTGMKLNDPMSGSMKKPRVDEKGNIFYATEYDNAMPLKKIMCGEEILRFDMYNREPLTKLKNTDFHRNPFAYLVGKELWEFSYRNKRSHKRYFTPQHLLAIKHMFQNIPLEMKEKYTEDGALILEVSSPWFTDEEWDQVTDLACMDYKSLMRRALFGQLERGLALGLWKFFWKFITSTMQK